MKYGSKPQQPRRFVDEPLVRQIDRGSVTQIIEEANSPVVTVTYDGDDLVTRVDFEDGTYRLITYTVDDFVDEIARYSALAILLETFQASYNGSDQFTGWTLV